MASFQKAVAYRQSVIENSIVREVTHGEVIDLADRAGVRCAFRVDPLDGDAPREHAFNLPDRGGCEREMQR